MHFIIIGEGPARIAVIPGAGDGLRTLDKSGFPLALHFRNRAREFTTLVLSRRQPVPVDFPLEQHGSDLLWVLDQLGWKDVILECNSAGGPLGQWMAVKRPELIQGLILSCTLHRSNPVTDAVIRGWLRMIAENRWTDFTWSSVEYTFRPKTVRQYRLVKPLLGLASPAPKDKSRIVNVLSELLDFDNRPILPSITCPVLVSGGLEDRVIPADIQREMASLIPGSVLKQSPGFGHGNDQENPVYERDVRQFVHEVIR